MNKKIVNDIQLKMLKKWFVKQFSKITINKVANKQFLSIKEAESFSDPNSSETSEWFWDFIDYENKIWNF